MDNKTVTLNDLQERIAKLEKEMAGIKKSANAPTKKAAPEKKAAAKPADVKELLTKLEQARKAGDTKLAFKIRRNLRKAGYSLRDANGKK